MAIRIDEAEFEKIRKRGKPMVPGSVTEPVNDDTKPADPATAFELAKKRGQPISTLSNPEDAMVAERVGQAFKTYFADNVDRHVAISEISRELGASPQYVEDNFDDVHKSWVSSKYNSDEWVRKNPELARALTKDLRNVTLVPHSEELPDLIKAFRTGSAESVMMRARFFKNNPKLERPADWNKLSTWDKLGWHLSRAFIYMPEFAEDGVAPTAGEVVEAEKILTQGVQPETKWYVNDKVAKEAQALSGPFRPFETTYLTLKDSQRATDVNLAYADLGFAKLGGGDTWAAKKRLIEAQNAEAPRFYGSKSWPEKMMQMGAETFGSSLHSYEGGLAGGAIAYGVPFLGELALSRGSFSKANKVARIFAPIGMKMGTKTATFYQEFGGFLRQTEGAKTDAGQPVDENLLLGTGLLYAAIAAEIETMSFSATQRMFGPIGDAIAKGKGAQYAIAMLKNSDFRKLAYNAAKAWGRRSIDEGSEEWLQGVARGFAENFAKAQMAGAPQDLKAGELVYTSTVEALQATLGAGAQGAPMVAAGAVANRYLANRAKVMESKAKMDFIHSAAAAPLAKSDPILFRSMVEQSTHGDVGAVFVDPATVVRIARENEIDPATLLGPNVDEIVAEHSANGTKYEVPLQEYVKWRQHALADKLKEHFSTGAATQSEEEFATENNEETLNFDRVMDIIKDKAKMPVSDAERKFTDTLKKSLVETEVVKGAQAENMVQLWRSFVLARAATENVDPDQVFSELEVQIRKVAESEAVPDDALLQPAYHGAKVDFEKFDMTFMGTGTGAQFYGYGMYFASDANLGNSYRRSHVKPVIDLRKRTLLHDDLDDATAAKAAKILENTLWNSILDDESNLPSDWKGKVRTILKTNLELREKVFAGSSYLTELKSAIKLIDELSENNIVIPNKGQLFKVDIPENSELLDNDKSMAEQSPIVLEKLRDSGLLPANLEMKMTGWKFYKFLSTSKGGDKEASLALNKAGIPGLIFNEATSGAKWANLPDMPNYVIWDDTRIQILEKFFQRGEKDLPNGYIERLGNILRISLTPNANLSTFLHESGHAFLMLMEHYASKEGASDTIKKDWQAVLKWFGVDSYKEITPEMHEAWARSFEQYLAEGKAPSLVLETAFDNFKKWMLKIYKQIKSLVGLGSDLNDNIRGVFDRLLATEQETEIYRKGLPDLFRTHEDAGVSPEEWGKYLESKARWFSRSRRAADRAVYREQLTNMTEQWKKEKELLKKDFIWEYENLPARRLSLALKGLGVEETGRVVPIGPPIKLKTSVVKEVLGKKGLDAFLTSKRGTDPSALAELYHFETVEEMFQELLTLKDRNTWANERATEEMDKRHPSYDQERERLKDLIADSMHSEETGRWLMQEVRFLRSKADPDSWDNWHKEFAFAPEQMIKIAAQREVDRKEVGKLNPHRILQSERAAADRAFRFVTQGRYKEALIAKMQQLYNYHLYRATAEARKNRDLLLNEAKKLKRSARKERIAKYSLVLMDGVTSVLESIGLKKPEVHERPLSYINQVAAALKGGTKQLFNEEVITRIVNDPRPWKKLTTTEAMLVLHFLQNIQASVEKQSTIMVYVDADHPTLPGTVPTTNLREGVQGPGYYRVDKATYIRQIIQEMEANRKDLGPKRTGQHWIKKIPTIGRVFDAFLLNEPTMLEWLGGEEHLNSITWRTLLQPLRDADGREGDIMRHAGKPIVDAFEAASDSIRKKFLKKIDGEKFFPTHRNDIINPPQNVFELAMLVWFAGTKENIQRLQEGRGITYDQVIAAANAYLDKDIMNWIQSIWHTTDKYLWPMVRDHEEHMSGVAPPRKVAVPMTLDFGTYTGGYAPAAYDWDTATVNPGSEQNPEDYMDPTYINPSTPHGHVKTMMQGKYQGVLALDNPGLVYASIAQVAHDIAFREAVTSVASIITNPEVEGAMKRRLGIERTAQFKGWLMDVGRMRGMEAVLYQGRINRFARVVKKKVGTAVLGYVPAIAAADLLNLVTAPIGTDLEVTYLARGLQQFLSSPFEQRSWVLDKSATMRNLQDHLIRHFAREVSRLNKPKNLLADVWYGYLDHAFAFTETTTAATMTPVWIGAYRQAMEDHGNEHDAVKFADDTVLKIFPSYSAVNMSGILRDKGLIGMGTVFHSYLNLMYNRARDTVEPVFQAHGLAKRAKTMARASGYLFAMFTVIGPMASLVMGRGPTHEPGEDDEENRKKWLKWLRDEYIMAPMSIIPGGGNIRHFLGDKQGPTAWSADPIGMVGSAFHGAFKEIGRAITKASEDDDVDWDRTFVASMRAFGMATGFSYRPFTEQGLFLKDMTTGQDKIQNPIEFGDKMLYGDRRQWTPGQLFYREEER